jgi:hypothetical protein
MTGTDVVQLPVLIRKLVVLQGKLLEAFKSAYPKAQDWQWLFHFPSTGEVSVDQEQWKFRKHGAGIAFTSRSGVVVDLHDGLPDTSLVDAWRLLLYLESIKFMKDSDQAQQDLEKQLAELARSGLLRKVQGSKHYRLLK